MQGDPCIRRSLLSSPSPFPSNSLPPTAAETSQPSFPRPPLLSYAPLAGKDLVTGVGEDGVGGMGWGGVGWGACSGEIILSVGGFRTNAIMNKL